MQALLVETCRRHQAGEPADERLQERYEAICQQAKQEKPLSEVKNSDRPKNSKGRDLLYHFYSHQASVLAFYFEERFLLPILPSKLFVCRNQAESRYVLSFF